MFVGTINKLDVTRTVLVETHYLDRFDSKYLSNDCFSIIIIKNGSITARIQNTDCHIPGPAVLCLDEVKTVKILSNSSSDVRIIKFDPQFLNVNMLISTIRSSHYEHLCQQHAFFQLSPFLTDDISKICIRLSKEALRKLNILLIILQRILKNKKIGTGPAELVHTLSI